jgi:hypothetical protein
MFNFYIFIRVVPGYNFKHVHIFYYVYDWLEALNIEKYRRAPGDRRVAGWARPTLGMVYM